jgi:hypothetical protein
MRTTSLAVPVLLAVSLLLAPARARAQPLFGWGQDNLEDQFVDGDIDTEDLASMRFGAHTGAAELHGGSWVSVVGFTKQMAYGQYDRGAMLVVGLALDRIATGPVHRLTDPPRPPDPGPVVPAPAPPAPKLDLVSPTLARSCVAAALRASGVGVDDARLDALVSRARASAWLPETRMRAMRTWTDANDTTTLTTTDLGNVYDTLGANLVLELRLTWRFDRLLYAGDEPTIERVRLERQDARSRLATRVLEVLFAWQRATYEAKGAPAGSREEAEARMRIAETEATLDVLTSGWFSERDTPPPPPGAKDPP